jgi:hypothetical protein
VRSEAFGTGSRSLTVTSLNPNLRVVRPVIFEPKHGEPSSAGLDARKTLGFTVGADPSFVQIAEYKSRLFLRDGYHRCYALLSGGVTRIPCIFIKVQDLREIGAGNPGTFSPDVLSSDRPPFVRDFLNDQVAVTVDDDALIKVVRIVAEEFTVVAPDANEFDHRH